MDLVDDVARSGRTQRKLVELATAGNANVVGLLSLIGIGRRWEHLHDLEIPIKIFYNL